jgi:hypothetical protein
MLLFYLVELGLCSRQRIAALVGVAPMNNDSGQFRGRRTIRAGRAELRRLLYMATLAATRSNPKIRRHYEKLLAAGKPKKLALVACMRKLLTILNAIVRDGKPWQTAATTTRQPTQSLQIIRKHALKTLTSYAVGEQSIPWGLVRGRTAAGIPRSARKLAAADRLARPARDGPTADPTRGSPFVRADDASTPASNR